MTRQNKNISKPTNKKNYENTEDFAKDFQSSVSQK